MMMVAKLISSGKNVTMVVMPTVMTIKVLVIVNLWLLYLLCLIIAKMRPFARLHISRVAKIMRALIRQVRST